jgi:hypothetical protein
MAFKQALFEQLDFIYMPSTDVARDADYFTSVLGAERVFSIEAYGTRVSSVRLADSSPELLFADHLKGERPILIYRVADIDRTSEALKARGWKQQPSFGIPHGPCCSFEGPGGHRIAFYQPTRPHASKRLSGRFDF